jgi:hypothetical protein
MRERACWRASPVAALPVGFLFPPTVSRPLAVSRLSQRKPAYERIFASRRVRSLTRFQ